MDTNHHHPRCTQVMPPRCVRAKEDPELLDSLLKEKRGKLKRQAQSWLRSTGASDFLPDLSDFVQLAQLAVANAIDKFRGCSSGEFEAFQRWKLKGVISTERRRRKTAKRNANVVPLTALDGSSPAPQPAAQGPSPSAVVAKNELAELLHGCLAELPGIARQIVELHYLKDLSFVEIGRLLNLRSTTISTYHQKALQQLKAILSTRTQS